jgi:2,3-dihydroxybenzoate decarboxylase
MQGKIALEEHFAIPETLMDSAGFVPDSYWPELKERLLDIQDKRLAQMDRHGVEMMILSLNAPAVQAIPDVTRANEIAIRANDFLAEQVAKRLRAKKGVQVVVRHINLEVLGK